MDSEATHDSGSVRGRPLAVLALFFSVTANFFIVRVKARRRVLASFAPLARLVLVSAYGTYQTRSVQAGKGYSFSKIREGHDRYRSDEDREERR